MDPDFGLKTMYEMFLFDSDLGTLDTSSLELVLFVVCCTTMYYF